MEWVSIILLITVFILMSISIFTLHNESDISRKALLSAFIIMIISVFIGSLLGILDSKWGILSQKAFIALFH